MLNKNDPLIGAVQEVMKRNQTERNATKLVNEKFGITDRRALPHERQHEWDSAYKSVLNEGLHPNQQKLDVHEPEKDELTKHDFKMLRAKKKKTMEEENLQEKATEGQKAKIAKVMHKWKQGKENIGKSDKTVPVTKSGQKQAVAIALSKAGLSKKK